MRKSLFIVLILLSITYQAQSQTCNDTISIVENHYEINGKPYKPNQLLTVLKSNPNAYNEMKKANANSAGAFIFAYTGGFMIGYPLGQALAGAKPNWALAGIGAGLVLIAIPFSTTSRTHAANAISIYNSGLKASRSSVIKISFCLTYDGVGLVYRF
jgi:hypothetical protein